MTKFDDFIKQEKKAAKEKGGFNAPERINKFKSLIDELYDKIDKEWLAQYIANGGTGDSENQTMKRSTVIILSRCYLIELM